jgi:phosphoribosylglycinamide formyltransferase-1
MNAAWNLHRRTHPTRRAKRPAPRVAQRIAIRTITGCTVHFVRAAVDNGPIVAQAALPVHPGDTEDTLAARVLQAEHELYPHALRLVASGQVHVEGEHVVGMPQAEGQTALFSPPLPGTF